MRKEDKNIVYNVGHAIKRWYLLYIKKNTDRALIVLKRIIGAGNSDLKQLKDSFKGEKCFIVCTGPSLTIKDLEMIKDCNAFSMNSIIKLFDQTEWRPKFYGIQDQNVFDKLNDEIRKCKFDYIFISDNIVKGRTTPSFNFYRFPLYIWGHNFFPAKPYLTFSDDISVSVSDGFSITYSLIQIACYMGFKTICLLGCDNSYEGEKQHVVESGHIDSNAKKSALMQREAFEVAKEYANKNGINIYNATRGGALEVFPRIALEEAVKDEFK